MDIRQLHHVSLPTTDLERSRRFHRELLGLAEIPFPENGETMLNQPLKKGYHSRATVGGYGRGARS